MKVKSYYAKSIEAAMASAAQEMGEDAVLITSRKTTAEAREFGEYEVVFGLMGEDEPVQRPVTRRTTESQTGQAGQPANQRAAQAMSEMEAVRRELEAMRRTISWHIGANGHSIPELSLSEALLTEADFAADLKEELLTALDVRLRQEALYNQAKVASSGDKRRGRGRAIEASTAGTEERSASLLREQLGMMLETAPYLGTGKDAARTVAAVVGPPGSGKTTTIVKLAIQYGLSSRRPTAIISADAYRVGATEQLRMFAAAMGVSFQAVETAPALRQALEEHRNKGLVLIDTPGFGPADMDAASDLARFLSSQPDIDVHLLLPATYRGSNIAKITQEFAIFGANKAILTKLDEAEGNGAALSHAILANLPVSFVTTGQRIPEDLKVADKDQLLSFLNEAEASAARSAA